VNGIDELVTAGYVTRDPLAPTAEGTQLGEEIEEHTDRRVQASFEILDEAASRELLEALRALPGSQ
jgi:hypothetical protein